MNQSSLRTDEEIEEVYRRHVDTVYRICFSFMKNTADTEDMVQETFLKFLTSKKKFQTDEHEKAWLIVTASNTCKDALKSWKRNVGHLEDNLFLTQPEAGEESSILSAILALPMKYKDVVYLYYYEGYKTSEIAKILSCPDSTVRNRLARARKLLEKHMD